MNTKDPLKLIDSISQRPAAKLLQLKKTNIKNIRRKLIKSSYSNLFDFRLDFHHLVRTSKLLNSENPAAVALLDDLLDHFDKKWMLLGNPKEQLRRQLAKLEAIKRVMYYKNTTLIQFNGFDMMVSDEPIKTMKRSELIDLERKISGCDDSDTLYKAHQIIRQRYPDYDIKDKGGISISMIDKSLYDELIKLFIH